MRPKNGLPDRAFSASAQSIASVRSDAFVRGGSESGPAVPRDAARAAERPARSGCGRSRSRDSRARRSRADATGCSRRRRNIRRCPTRPRPASGRRARRDLSGGRRRAPAATRLPLSSRGNARCPACRADCCCRPAAARPQRRPVQTNTSAARSEARHERGGYDEWSCAAVSHVRTSDENQAFVYVGLHGGAGVRGGRPATPAAPPSIRRLPARRTVTALATAQFATVTALSTTYDAGSATQPAHCVVRGSAAPRTGADGKPYETRFELRLPTAWSGRFLYQGGGGNDGVVAPAVGRNTGSFPDTGLQRGFAVVTTDAGHQGVTRRVRSRSGRARRSRVRRARTDVHHRDWRSSRATTAAHPTAKYFVGCSGGGRQGMMFAQRYPAYFDGIAICAPAMSVSSGATIAAAWDTQTYLVRRAGRCERSARAQPRVQRRRPGARRARHHRGVRCRRRRDRRDGPPSRGVPLRSEDVCSAPVRRTRIA